MLRSQHPHNGRSEGQLVKGIVVSKHFSQRSGPFKVGHILYIFCIYIYIALDHRLEFYSIQFPNTFGPHGFCVEAAITRLKARFAFQTYTRLCQ